MKHATSVAVEELVTTSADIDVAVIGAGPYGLSLGHRLRDGGVDVHLFGTAMSSWTRSMPKGMLLKSEPCASSIFDMAGQLSFDAYCRDHGLPPPDRPIPVEQFVDYGLWYLRSSGLEVSPEVCELTTSRGTFRIARSDGQRVTARRVVLATGLPRFAHVPRLFAGLPNALVTHASAHNDLSVFAGQDVTVIGAGQSALESAALVYEQGAAAVRVLARHRPVRWNATSLTRRTTWERARRPASPIGPGWRGWVFCNLPAQYRYLPVARRASLARRPLPSGMSWVKARLDDRVPVLEGASVRRATERDGRVALEVVDTDQQTHSILTDHVLLGTGYRVDMARLPFLHPDILGRLKVANGAPILGRGFTTSMPKLYCTGPLAATTFGPLMRFVCGTKFASSRLGDELQS